MILEFKTPAEADETADPKHVWIDGNRVVVYTGDDIPPPPPAMEATYTESEVVALLKSAGKTDAEAKTMLNAGLVKVIAK